jgi:hypothetical protein
MRSGSRCVQMAIAAAGQIGTAAVTADAEHGELLAKRWCATCHVIDGNQAQASADVPAFATIARKPDFTPEKLASFLLDPHPKMPSFPLSRRRQRILLPTSDRSARTRRPLSRQKRTKHQLLILVVHLRLGGRHPRLRLKPITASASLVQQRTTQTAALVRSRSGSRNRVHLR